MGAISQGSFRSSPAPSRSALPDGEQKSNGNSVPASREASADGLSSNGDIKVEKQVMPAEVYSQESRDECLRLLCEEMRVNMKSLLSKQTALEDFVSNSTHFKNCLPQQNTEDDHETSIKSQSQTVRKETKRFEHQIKQAIPLVTRLSDILGPELQTEAETWV